MEPLVQGAAGMLVHPEGYLRAVRELCDRHGVLLICDEVATGFGRTGRMFACEHEDVAPDLMCVAKGITGGYMPLAATLATERIYEGFLGAHEEFRTFFHGHTYTGNPLACAAALATLDVFERSARSSGCSRRSSCSAQLLEPLAAHPAVEEIRRRGFMTGIELVEHPVERRMGHQVTLEARRRGAIIRPLGDTIVLMPPLSISETDLRAAGGDHHAGDRRRYGRRRARGRRLSATPSAPGAVGDGYGPPDAAPPAAHRPRNPPRHRPRQRRHPGLLGLATGGRAPNVFTTLARHRGLFRRWLWFAAALMPGGKLPRDESELVILRVAHNTGSDYEWAQHERLGRARRSERTRRSRACARDRTAPGWSSRRELLLRATDELHAKRHIGDELWAQLRTELDELRLIELCMLVGHYEMLAMTLNSLAVESDPIPDQSGALTRRLLAGAGRRGRT